MGNRNINMNRSYNENIMLLCSNKTRSNRNYEFVEDNTRYLKQCLCNLQEKYDRKIITKEEWDRIINSDVMRNINVETLLDWK